MQDTKNKTLLKVAKHGWQGRQNLSAKQAGKIAYFVLDRLVIRDKPSSD